MKAIVAPSLQWTEIAEPVPTADEILVNISAVALTNLLKGQAAGTHYSVSGGGPFVPGIDGVGRLPDGRRVYFMATHKPHGALAEKTLTRDGFFVPLPDDLPDARAAAIANPAMSSWAALTKRAGLRTGETVLVNGATGVSGKMAVQIAKHLGAKRVIATGRNPQELEVARTLGADEIVKLDDAFAESAKQLAGEIDVVLDYLWGASAETLIKAIAQLKTSKPVRYVNIGSLAGANIALPAQALRATALQLMGSGLGSVDDRDLVQIIGEALKVAQKINLHVDINEVPIEQAPAKWNEPGADRIVFTVAR